MKRFIKKVLLFCCFALFLYVACLMAFVNVMPRVFAKNFKYPFAANGHMLTRLKEAKTIGPVNILFLGSSHAYRGFDPRAFDTAGIKTFNLGSSAQTPIQSEYLLKNYLNYLKPETIVIEVYPGVFELDGIESSLDIIANEKFSFRTWELGIKNPHIYVLNSLLYASVNNLLGNNQEYKESEIKGDDLYIKGGYVEKKVSYFKKVEYNKQHWDFNNKQFTAFGRMLKFIRSKNIPFILLQAPITHSLYSSYSNNQQFDSLMKQYGPYLNYNELMNLDDSIHFYDPHHMNQLGVKIFNKEVIKLFPNGQLSSWLSSN